MFRVTIYAICAYAFWLTFVDVSAFFEPEENSTEEVESAYQTEAYAKQSTQLQPEPVIIETALLNE
ncbi:hypothetical protein FLM48_09460 [Shewanella sp. Scap07]|uniref:hypothetical protein n=1 Tax=Shewanella sp. Scap07 TaxID=2589987 RepID=UPI0015BEB4BB|nr:hypothetical protein [Shewanella sp. Scap07]QLE85293.1 hypothetical protein FLM48_09460 [Shewanella sp. Scap07]